jgi:hypothetical protein
VQISTRARRGFVIFHCDDPNDLNDDPYWGGEEADFNGAADWSDLSDFELGELEETYIPERACHTMNLM